MQQPSRTRKREGPPEKTPSSAVPEVTAIVQESGRPGKKRKKGKKRAIETAEVGDEALPTPGSQAGPSQSSNNHDGSGEPTPGSTSRSESAVFAELLPDEIEDLHELLHAFLHHEAPPSENPSCHVCNSPAGYQCLECFSEGLVCERCLLSQYTKTPLREIQKWNGHVFEEATLAAAGLVIQFGHRINDTCTAPSPTQDLTVFDLAGAHRLVVRWCACDGAPPKRIQLFRRRWFPATAEDPSSAFTFDMLGLFHDLKNQNEDESAFHRVVTEYAKDAGLNPEMYPYADTTAVLYFWGELKRGREAARR